MSKKTLLGEGGLISLEMREGKKPQLMKDSLGRKINNQGERKVSHTSQKEIGAVKTRTFTFY
jgi:hypothetical protein